MRSRPWPAFRPQRELAVAGLASLGAGLLMLASAAGAAASAGSPAAGTSRAAAQYPLAAHPPTRGKPSRAADRQYAAQVKQLTALTHADAVTHSPITVTGPHMWDPSLNGGKGGQNPKASTVTVSQTADMVNQMVQVSWTNFTTSINTPYLTATDYAVMVAECNGTNPSSPADCYGAEDGGVAANSGTTGPPNTAYATTAANGAGIANIVIQTKVENSSLVCDQTHPCSLAIVPAQGGNPSFTPPRCNDHSQDIGFAGNGTAARTRKPITARGRNGSWSR